MQCIVNSLILYINFILSMYRSAKRWARNIGRIHVRNWFTNTYENGIITASEKPIKKIKRI